MRLIDANELYRMKFHGYPDIMKLLPDANTEAYKRGWNDAIDTVAECAPVVEVVRCKDCKHCFVDGDDDWRYNVCYFNRNMVHDDWFCADGERRENDGTN